jgi:pimeloyl-ACP methyl ester carboxylesterase
VIAGADDHLISVSQTSAIADAIPGARLVVVSGAAHLPTLEAPSVVTDAIRTLLAGIA